MKLRISWQKVDSPSVDISIEVEPFIYVVDLKLVIQTLTDINTSDQSLSIISNGASTKLEDSKLLSDYSITPNTQIILAQNRQNPEKTKPKAHLDKPKISTKTPKTENIPKDVVLKSSQSYFENLLGKDESVKNVLEKNPEIGQIMSDPNLLKENLEIASNPALLNELLRSKDRIIQNVENHPEGFNVLHRMYSSVEEPLHNALKNSFSGRTFKNTERPDQTSGRFHQPGGDAIPNPWRPAAPSWGAPPPRAKAAAEDPSIRFSSQLRELQQMGFTDTNRNIRALIQTGGNVEAAVDLLLSV